jgi:hypothetical protein
MSKNVKRLTFQFGNHMIERIIEFINTSWRTIAPFVIVDQFEKGVILRFGKYHKNILPGFNFKIPLIDSVHTVEAVQTTIRIQPQTLTTRDDMTITTSAVLTYEIRDPKLFLLEVWEGREAIKDITLAEIKKIVAQNKWEDLNKRLIETLITTEVRKQGKLYGVYVKKFGFADLAKIKTIRLITGTGEAWDD